MSRFYVAEDYAGLSLKNGRFDYGYEFACGVDEDGAECEVWGFTGKLNDTEVAVEYGLKEWGPWPDKFEVTECLMHCIGIFLERYV